MTVNYSGGEETWSDSKDFLENNAQPRSSVNKARTIDAYGLGKLMTKDGILIGLIVLMG